MENEQNFFVRFKELHHQKSSIPQSILDQELRILWYNTAFSELFHREEECIGEHIGNFTRFTGIDGRSLHHQLNDPATGYSFIGDGETRFQHHPALFINVQMLPLFEESEKDKSVSGYCAYFHDVSRNYKNNLRTIFNGLLQASLMKDNDTGQHIERVNRYSSIMAETLYADGTYLQITRDFVENLSFLAAMHDVGKIGVPDDILNKDGPLDDWEWELMKTHTVNGAYILGSYPDPMAVEIARSHHERWDGSGYPYGLMEEMIPVSARIVTIADVYDALRSKRSYKEAMPHEQTVELIRLGKGTQFDPELVDLFLRLEKQFAEIYSEMQDPTSSDPSHPQD